MNSPIQKSKSGKPSKARGEPLEVSDSCEEQCTEFDVLSLLSEFNREGEPKKYFEIARRHLPARLRSIVSPDDLVQAACTDLFRQRFQIENNCNLEAYFITIIKNKAAKLGEFWGAEKRCIKRMFHFSSIAKNDGMNSFDPEGKSTEDTEGTEKERERKLQIALDGLEPNERQAICARMASISRREIAQEMKITIRQVKTLLTRAREKLRRILRDN